MARLHLKVVLVVCALSSCHVCAENRFFFEDIALPHGQQASISLKADTDQEIIGFSFAVRYDPHALSVAQVTLAGTASENAEFFDGVLDEASGRLGYGCVLDMSPPLTGKIRVGQGHELAKVVVDVIGQPGTITTVSFDDMIQPNGIPIVSRMVDWEGWSITPGTDAGLTLISASFKIEERLLPETEFLRSDSTGDGVVNISDAVNTLAYLMLGRKEPGCLKAADGDDTGTILITDAIYLLNFLFLGGPPPEAPFPSCGPDTTEDTLTCEWFPPCQ